MAGKRGETQEICRDARRQTGAATGGGWRAEAAGRLITASVSRKPCPTPIASCARMNVWSCAGTGGSRKCWRGTQIRELSQAARSRSPCGNGSRGKAESARSGHPVAETTPVAHGVHGAGGSPGGPCGAHSPTRSPAPTSPGSPGVPGNEDWRPPPFRGNARSARIAFVVFCLGKPALACRGGILP